MHEHDDLAHRLRDLGAGPVDPGLRADHVAAMRAATAAPPRRFGRLAVAAAAIVGFTAGSAGFAMAGALPDPAQGVAHDVLSVVQVEVPDRPATRGACVSEAARTHRGDQEAKAAAKDGCPRGGRPDEVGGGRPEDAGAGRPEGAGRPDVPPGQVGKPADHPNARTDDCRGKPPWAGRRGGPSEAERADLEARCPARAGDDADDRAQDGRENADQAQPAPGGQGEPGGAPPAVAPADPPVDPAVPADPVVPPVSEGTGDDPTADGAPAGG